MTRKLAFTVILKTSSAISAPEVSGWAEIARTGESEESRRRNAGAPGAPNLRAGVAAAAASRAVQFSELSMTSSRSLIHP